VEIPKATGGTRPLGIPTVLDRLIQQAIARVLTPIFNPGFSDASFGFRPGRSAHDAVYRTRETIRKGYRIAVDLDLSKFFDTVDHDVLMHRVARKVRDKWILRLIGRYLRAGQRVMQSVQRFLERILKLRVNQDKSRVVPTDQATFLGFTFRGVSIRWTDKAFQEFKRRVKELTGRSWFVSMDFRFQKLAQYLRGWVNYFGISDYYRPIPEIDHWLRRRVRMCYWKQWRRARTKVR
jgi:RNA-directed DNA polymerase